MRSNAKNGKKRLSEYFEQLLKADERREAETMDIGIESERK